LVVVVGKAFACFLDIRVFFQDFFILAKLLFFLGLLGLQHQSRILFIGILPFLGFPTTSSLFSNTCSQYGV